MARLCPKCGAQTGDATRFCIQCGTEVYQQYSQQQGQQPRPAQYPQNWQQQGAQQPAQYGRQQPPLYAQPPNPQYAPQQPNAQFNQQYPQGQPYPAPAGGAQGKKRRIPLALIIIAGSVLVIGIVIVVALTVTGNIGDKDWIKIGKDEVPSVKLILGEKRAVTGVSTSVENGVTSKAITYSAAGNQSEEMQTYVHALVYDYGYYYLNEADFSDSRGTDFRFAKESVEEGYIVVVRIDYDRSGYTVTLSRGTGTLTVK